MNLNANARKFRRKDDKITRKCLVSTLNCTEIQTSVAIFENALSTKLSTLEGLGRLSTNVRRLGLSEGLNEEDWALAFDYPKDLECLSGSECYRVNHLWRELQLPGGYFENQGPFITHARILYSHKVTIFLFITSTTGITGTYFHMLIKLLLFKTKDCLSQFERFEYCKYRKFHATPPEPLTFPP